MVRLQISIAAFSAIARKLPASVGFEIKRAANGDWFIWLDHATISKLTALRGPGDSYSDVIIRVGGLTEVSVPLPGCVGSFVKRPAIGGGAALARGVED